MPPPHRIDPAPYGGYFLFWEGANYHIWAFYTSGGGLGPFNHQISTSRGLSTTINAGTARSFAYAAEQYQSGKPE